MWIQKMLTKLDVPKMKKFSSRAIYVVLQFSIFVSGTFSYSIKKIFMKRKDTQGGVLLIQAGR